MSGIKFKKKKKDHTKLQQMPQSVLRTAYQFILYLLGGSYRGCQWLCLQSLPLQALCGMT